MRSKLGKKLCALVAAFFAIVVGNAYAQTAGDTAALRYRVAKPAATPYEPVRPASNIGLKDPSNFTNEVEYDEETDQMVFKADGHLRKKTLADFMRRIKVYGEDEHKPRVIQDNKMFAKHTQIDSYEMPLGLHDYDTTLTVTRDGIIPRIAIEKYVKKMVVRQDNSSETAYIDLYLPTDASQFGKTDAILIANLYRMYEEKNFRSDLTDFESMEWFSDKAWNSDDVCLFKYDNLELVDINIFDGSYVLTFTGRIVSDGEYLAKKYETDELTAKYNEKAPKGDTVGMFVSTNNDNKGNSDKE